MSNITRIREYEAGNHFDSQYVSDPEQAAIQEAVRHVWCDSHVLAIALDDLSIDENSFEDLSAMWELSAVPFGDHATPLQVRTQTYLTQYNEAIESYVIENELHK